jgi:hypothetical protein
MVRDLVDIDSANLLAQLNLGKGFEITTSKESEIR